MTASRGRAVHQWAQRVAGRQRGSLLVETVIAVSVFGLLGTAVLSGVQTSYTSKRNFEARSVAENLVRSQIEHVMEQSYVPPGSMYPTVSPPAGYTVAVEALAYDPSSTDIETVRVTVLHGGLTLKTFEMLRTDR